MNRRLLPGLLLIAASGCSTGNPTAVERRVTAGPALDGGVMHGSGNRTDTTVVNTTAATSGEATATAAERTGVMHGSGN
jgi:hypothetical protein